MCEAIGKKGYILSLSKLCVLAVTLLPNPTSPQAYYSFVCVLVCRWTCLPLVVVLFSKLGSSQVALPLLIGVPEQALGWFLQ